MTREQVLGSGGVADSTLPPEPSSSQDPVAAFLAESSDLVSSILKEPTEEERRFQRIRDVEARIAQQVTQKGLKDFLDAYRKKTGKYAKIKLLGNSNLVGDPTEFWIDTAGFVVLQYGVSETKGFKPFKLSSLDEGGNAVYKELDGDEVYIVDKQKYEQEPLGDISFFTGKRKMPDGNEGRESLISFLSVNGHINNENVTNMITENVLKDMTTMKQEMEPTASFPPPPAANRPAGPTGQS